MKRLAAMVLLAMTAVPTISSAMPVAAAATREVPAQPSGIVENPPDPTAPGATVKDDGIVSDGVDIVERLGERAQIDVPLVNQDGKVVRLRDYLGKRPVILALVYYRCPVLCSLLLSGLAKSLQQVDWQAGKEFDVITVSIDPNETTDLAKEKRRGYLQALGRQGSEGAWPFFTGAVESIDALAASVGFKFKYIARERQFAHVSTLFFLSPQGVVTRYLYGVSFDPKEVKLALFEAADGRVGTGLERVLLRCYKFDASARKYHLWIKNYYRVWGVIIILALGTFLGTLWRREFKRSSTGGRSRPPSGGQSPSEPPQGTV